MVRFGTTRRGALQLWVTAGAIVVLAAVLAASSHLGVITGLLLAVLVLIGLLYRLDRLRADECRQLLELQAQHDALAGLQEQQPASSANEQLRDVILRVLAAQDGELYDHVNDVARLAAAVGHRLGLDAGDAADLVRAAELHDVGKVAIPDRILQKPGPLAPDEQQFMRRHTLIGENILSAASALAGVGRLVRSSHERYDGTGYPDRLRQDEIPLASRIIFVCDAYNAMTSDRPYRKAMQPEDAVVELRRCANTQFDPAVVDAFVAELGEVRARKQAIAGVGS
jgi:HD-GYP domain-containing protein (c-di-GMP phosphodiesterase class II)